MIATRPSCGIEPEQVARLIELVASGELSAALARQVVDGVLETGADVDQVVADRGLKLVSDSDALTRRPTRRSRPTPMSPTRCETARSPRSACWSVP